MSELQLKSTDPWAPHPSAAPRTERGPGELRIGANGTRTCAGGWQLTYAGVAPGVTYRVEVDVAHEDLAVWRDALQCQAVWGEMDADAYSTGSGDLIWDYLTPEPVSDGTTRFARDLTAPAGAECLSLRYTFRWTDRGSSSWGWPRIQVVTPPPSSDVKVAVVTGHESARQGRTRSIEDNVEFYARLCESAAATGPDLMVLPEVAVQWEVAGSPLDLAVPAPGPETDAFAQIARQHGTRILLGVFERDGDAVFNSAVLIDPEGRIEGKYHKVHLAVGGETESGILPGDGFPVFDTEIGRLGCNICMDSSAAESARMVGLNGADLLLLPIMGDHRASRWNPGSPIFNESRWKAIMRTHAMDNQVCMVVARNRVQGSCIVDRKGEILAWNEGDEDWIAATVPRDDGYLTWNGGCFRAVNWMQRRPHLYGAYTDESNRGSL